MDLIRFIFACFGIFANTIYSRYSLQNLRKDSNTNIRFNSKQIHVATNIRKTFSEFHIQANIRLQIFAYKKILACKYSLHIAIASNYIGRPSQGERVKPWPKR